MADLPSDVAPLLRAAARRRLRTWRRLDRLHERGFASYSEYLGSAHWRSLKVRFRASDQPQECICGGRQGLHLHHRTYARAGSEVLTDLALLCRRCFAAVHALEREHQLDLPGFTADERAAAHGLRAQEAAVAHGAAHCIGGARRAIDEQIATVRAEAVRRGLPPVDVGSDVAAIHRRFEAIGRKLADKP